MNASVPAAPYGKNALLTHAAAFVFGVASALCNKFVPDPSGPVFAVMAAIASGVIWCWALFLAVRSINFENRRRFAWTIIILSLAEATLPSIPPWLHVFQSTPDFLDDSKVYWSFVDFASSCAFPVFAPFLAYGFVFSIAVSRLITRGQENRWSPRRGKWTVGIFAGLAFTALPWPLFLYCGVMARKEKHSDWNTRIADFMPYPVCDGVAGRLYSPKPGTLQSIHDKFVDKRLVSRYYVIALSRKMLSGFSANPTQRGAEELAHLLSGGRLPKEEGEAILRALATPTFFSRTSYAIGNRASFSFKMPFDVSFEKPMEYQTVSCKVHLDEQRYESGHNGEGGIALSPRPRIIESSETLTRPGAYHGTITYSHRVHEGWKGPVAYELSFKHSFDFQAVPAGSEEKVQLVSNPALDALMSSAFATAPASRGTSGGINGKRVDVISAIDVNYSALPENVAFRITYHDSTGKVKTLNPIIMRRGNAGIIFPEMASFFSEAAGSYSGTMVLEPDPDAAIRHADIKQIWKGKISLPFKFTVRQK